MMLRKMDLLWLIAYPIYQIIGTLRHEGSHAIAALLEGASVTEFVFWPSFTEYGFYWGYVQITGSMDWIFFAAPYLVDFLTFTLFFCVCMWVIMRRKWIWLNIVIIGLISPFVNSLYNYWGSAGAKNDVGNLLASLPRNVVHGYFLLTSLVYIIGIFLVFRFSKTARFIKTPASEIQE